MTNKQQIKVLIIFNLIILILTPFINDLFILKIAIILQLFEELYDLIRRYNNDK